jgi:thiamine-monophosphate kinase
MPTDLGGLGEAGIIAKLAEGMLLNPEGVCAGVGDDCAVIDAGGDRVWLVTTDLLMEDVHFLREKATPDEIGHKSLAVNLSDIAAMGGTPRHAFLSLALSEEIDETFLDGFRSGFETLARLHRVNLLGGDLSRSRSGLGISVTVIGEAEADQVLYRSGARAGDKVYVTGTLGDSAAGLEKLLLQDGSSERSGLERAHLTPMPRVEEGRFLAGAGPVTACIDLSDGLSTDLGHVCRLSGAGAVVNEESVPLSDEFRAEVAEDRRRSLRLALSGGEDYQLCFTVNPEYAGDLERDYHRSFGDNIHPLGEIVAGDDGIWLEESGGGRTRLGPGHDHFTQTKTRER